MRHRLSGRHLGRTAAHRAALYRNLAKALLTFEVIKTTVPKAKELRRFVEPLITLAKVDTVANRRLAQSRLRDEAVVAKLFNVIGKLSANRNGGYTPIFKGGFSLTTKTPPGYNNLTTVPYSTFPAHQRGRKSVWRLFLVKKKKEIHNINAT